MKKLILILCLLPIWGFSQGNFMFNQHALLVANIDTSTYVNIIFDSSGSMNTTKDSLQIMVDTYLQDSLIGYYNNNEDIYNRKVSIISYPNEKTFSSGMLNYNIDVIRNDITNKVVNLVFQDEASPIYYSSFDTINTLTSTYSSDISNLRDSIGQYNNTLKYTGVIFQVNYPANDFEEFIMAVSNGYGNYSGVNGLSDKSDQFVYYYNITDGGTPIYYTNLLIDALRNLGFNL